MKYRNVNNKTANVMYITADSADSAESTRVNGDMQRVAHLKRQKS